MAMGLLMLIGWMILDDVSQVSSLAIVVVAVRLIGALILVMNKR